MPVDFISVIAFGGGFLALRRAILGDEVADPTEGGDDSSAAPSIGGASVTHPPTVNPSDWSGWVWPVPVTDGRIPTITQEFKPWDGGDRNATTRGANHLGVDIMFPKRAGDPPGVVRHDASRSFIAPKGTPIVAAGPGMIWSVGEGAYGRYVTIDHGAVGSAGGCVTFYQHLELWASAWRKGDRVTAGQMIGVMGYSPALDGEQLRHLHFELRFPRTDLPANRWPVNPAPYMRHWKKVPLNGGNVA